VKHPAASPANIPIRPPHEADPLWEAARVAYDAAKAAHEAAAKSLPKGRPR
jgi:hypothetical protein